jgi:hypothetical protein
MGAEEDYADPDEPRRRLLLKWAVWVLILASLVGIVIWLWSGKIKD